MQFKSIEIRSFRRLVRPVRLDSLQPGLNVVAGDNEEGKSTVLEALRAALFEKHTLSGEGASRLQPFGSSVRPQVELLFERDGQAYRLTKGFCQSPAAELQGPGQQWSGPAAEERLRELFGFTPPSRGQSKPQEHHGVSGLLWVSQGTAFQPLEMGESCHNALRAALEGQVGDVLGGDQGESILRRIAEDYGRFFTATGRRRGPYRQAEEAVAALEQELAEVEERLSVYEQKVDRLQRQQTELQDLDRPQVRQDLVQRLEQARREQEQLDALRRRVEAADQAVRLAEAQKQGPETRWIRRQEDIRALELGGEERTRLQQEVAGIEPDLEQAETRLKGQQQALEEADEALAKVREAETQAEEQVHRAEQAERLEKLRSACERGRRTVEALHQARTVLKEIRVQEGDLETLRELERQLIRAGSVVEAGATRVNLALTVPVTRSEEGTPVASQLTLTGPITLQIGTVGSLTITPGGQELEEAAREWERLQALLKQNLQRLGVAGVEEAQGQLNRRQGLQQQVESLQEQLNLHAPEGLDSLDQERQDLERELAGQNPPTPPEAREELQRARERRQNAQQQRDRQQREVESARQQRDERRQQRVERQAELGAQNRQVTALEQRLDQARRSESDADLLEARQAARQALEQATVQAEQARLEEQAAQPERVVLQLETAERALNQHDQRVQKLENGVHELQIELRSSGQMEVGERREELQADLEQARGRLAAVTREAESLALLHQVLQEEAKRARQTFLGPILERVKPYLALLMPEVELLLDEQMTLKGVLRRGVEEPFQSLSVGTREQLAVLVRLAFGELLRECGQPVVLILDDALVYADDGRLEQMKLILARAARHFQILILTCREADYRSLGAPTWRLADCMGE